MSTEPNVDIPERIWPTANILSEIRWCEEKITSLQPKLLKRPSAIREIKDLERQIEDKKKVLNFRAGR